jgi:hypothetical protein
MSGCNMLEQTATCPAATCEYFADKKVKYKGPNIKKLYLFPSSYVIYPYVLGLCKKLGDEYLKLGPL